ncbi:hypothetical protein [Tautonia sociabilis]|uniref:Uncharacterized protein n=1 Tax=Tautonia sociabilis TaxID=2080755 RepID=A0A432MEX1_9BACT|nr:hypothetical protein [Tautonia sociabilis]RUL84228.1 hypothetical protein TsocGM_20780 [Tautonia sociabilis]
MSSRYDPANRPGGSDGSGIGWSLLLLLLAGLSGGSILLAVQQRRLVVLERQQALAKHVRAQQALEEARRASALASADDRPRAAERGEQAGNEAALPDSIEALQQENARLRAEINRLRDAIEAANPDSAPAGASP